MKHAAQVNPTRQARCGRQTLLRIVIGIAGGYILSIVTAVGLAQVLPMSKGDAVMASILLSFVFYCAAIVWAFSARTLRRAWLGIVLWTAAFGVIAAIGAGATA